GTVSLEVEWAYTKWHVSAGDVVEGKEFITDIKPSYVGAENEGLTKTKVNLTISVNNTHSYNSQKLILRSLTNNFSDTIVIKQAAKPIEPINIAIDPATTYQTIAGFGGAAIWHSLPLSNSHIETLFGTGED